MITRFEILFEPRSDLSPEEVQKGLRFVVVRELMAEVGRGEKSLSTIGGLRQLTFFPLQFAYNSMRRYSWLWKNQKIDGQDDVERNRAP